MNFFQMITDHIQVRDYMEDDKRKLSIKFILRFEELEEHEMGNGAFCWAKSLCNIGDQDVVVEDPIVLLGDNLIINNGPERQGSLTINKIISPKGMDGIAVEKLNFPEFNRIRELPSHPRLLPNIVITGFNKVTIHSADIGRIYFYNVGEVTIADSVVEDMDALKVDTVITDGLTACGGHLFMHQVKRFTLDRLMIGYVGGIITPYPDEFHELVHQLGELADVFKRDGISYCLECVDSISTPTDEPNKFGYKTHIFNAKGTSVYYRDNLKDA